MNLSICSDLIKFPLSEKCHKMISQITRKENKM